jgi:hypothetical protein
MANKKISELTLFASANSTDEIPVNRLGMNGKLTVSSLSSPRYIGESYGGGVIFYLYKDSLGVEHGLIVSIADLGTTSVFSNITTSLGTTTTWNGQTNTNLIKAQVGATSGAWKLCDDYTYSGYSDWYLPAVDEFSLLGQNRFHVNKTLSTIVGANTLGAFTYWTSSESAGTNAWTYLNGNKYVSEQGKSSAGKVRAIRQF